MTEQRGQTTADFFGFFAYLAIMNGGWPDLDLLSAGYVAGADDPPEAREQPRLTLVRVPPEPASNEDAEADIAAA